MPATSPGVCSRISAPKRLRSQYLRYMRMSICAQSCASVPPAPAWMSMKQLFGSSGLENMRRNSSAATSVSNLARSEATPASVASSFSGRAMSKSSFASWMPDAIDTSAATVESSAFFSRPSSCARFWSLQTPGSAKSCSTAESLRCLPSRSKIPPQLVGPFLQVGERRGDLVDAFCFHVGFRSGRFHALAPVAHFLAEARLGLEPVERHDQVAARDRDEGLLQALAHGREIEVTRIAGPLHHEQQKIALVVGRDLRDAQHVLVLESALARLQHVLGDLARNAHHVGDVGAHEAIASALAQPPGDAAQADAVRAGDLLQPGRHRRRMARQGRQKTQESKCKAQAPHRLPDGFLALV